MTELWLLAFAIVGPWQIHFCREEVPVGAFNCSKDAAACNRWLAARLLVIDEVLQSISMWNPTLWRFLWVNLATFYLFDRSCLIGLSAYPFNLQVYIMVCHQLGLGEHSHFLSPPCLIGKLPNLGSTNWQIRPRVLLSMLKVHWHDFFFQSQCVFIWRPLLYEFKTIHIHPSTFTKIMQIC